MGIWGHLFQEVEQSWQLLQKLVDADLGSVALELHLVGDGSHVVIQIRLAQEHRSTLVSNRHLNGVTRPWGHQIDDAGPDIGARSVGRAVLLEEAGHGHAALHDAACEALTTVADQVIDHRADDGACPDAIRGIQVFCMVVHLQGSFHCVALQAIWALVPVLASHNMAALFQHRNDCQKPDCTKTVHTNC